ncbi:cytolethal distending toxin subunit B family protein [Salmonella enterica]|uniref:Cytolethal distending toxin subunit B family protein n=3 Tax=Salmonella enterica TaxID=28901 RepID=A0A3Y9C5W7_SALEB|nr:cytolethal distending toxin subunit B family protein [Salmonella enterica subsp. enterica serovar Java]EAO1480864.1 cytolethal distending toxin subunit B family protein [Salmonella enterica]EBG5027242.1 cytolethal distending toxin subunit B family protein [Salmonella enterica subsp. enterica serovar Oranienburg]EBR9314718.1 cytolethal distending toxin subunit B family protein [Salmonella enterica subsp. enterica serovar Muenchen]EBW7255747.1 cytolethal distending toxin subunit B family prote
MKNIIPAGVFFAIMMFSLRVDANISDYKIMTWNLQGSSSASENKWNINVRQLVTGMDGADILMVQEAGSVPATAMLTGRQIQPVGVGIPIDEYTWNLGTTRRPDIRYIYFSRVDVGANRVNLAIVSRRRADQVFVIRPATVASRPVIGISLANDVFLTTHALAGGGPDALAIIRTVNDFFNQPSRLGYSWFMAGDFNRAPGRLENDLVLERLDRAVTVVAPGVATQSSGGILDYGVIVDRSPSAGTLGATISFGNMASQLSSDHLPVMFNSQSRNNAS